jgi:mono/diheme cytochrome c family protein
LPKHSSPFHHVIDENYNYNFILVASTQQGQGNVRQTRYQRRHPLCPQAARRGDHPPPAVEMNPLRIPRRFLLAAFVSTLVWASAAVGDTASSQTARFPPGPGLESFLASCSSCHGPEIVTVVRLSPAGWEGVVLRMVQRGAVGTESDFTQIVDYLSRNFGPSDPTAVAKPGPAAEAADAKPR